MNVYEVFVNEELYRINDTVEIIKLLQKDDEFLIQYIINKIKMGTGPQVTPHDINGFLNIRRPEPLYTSSLINLEDSTEILDEDMEMSQFSNNETEMEEMTPDQGLYVWSQKGKKGEEDVRAITEMLELRASEKYTNKFDDKKSVKLTLWKEIAEELCKKGYIVDAQKCRQKFANLTKTYIRFVRHCHKTGNNKINQPEYYDLLHKILGNKDKVQLNDVQDSLNVTGICEENILTDIINDTASQQTITTAAASGSCEKPSTSGTQHKKRHLMTKTDIVKKVVESNERLINVQKENVDKICDAIREQNNILKQQIEQKDRLLSIFEKVMSKQDMRFDKL